jgi:hypothetical protein
MPISSFLHPNDFLSSSSSGGDGGGSRGGNSNSLFIYFSYILTQKPKGQLQKYAQEENKQNKHTHKNKVHNVYYDDRNHTMRSITPTIMGVR